DQIAPAVRNIHAYWLARRTAPTAEMTGGPQQRLRKGSLPGRNDPCPCGSGKKFKRCHGAPDTLH
ncbi:MAG: SEC-C metal-binding domain-containing protein, partial [Gammaproteobacteria bacterium]|nr:SEC-C metal-binding domain-containing protein [Gammaproteobacteria bacterium]